LRPIKSSLLSVASLAAGGASSTASDRTGAETMTSRGRKRIERSTTATTIIDLPVATRSGGQTSLDAAAVADLQAGLRGELLRAGSDGYDAARAIWNRNVDSHPALIARCIGAADVMRSVDFAREHDLLLSVRGGGHNMRGTCVADAGMVIDLSYMTSIRVDSATRTARAEGGTKWGQFDHETQAFGLACTGGTNYDTGIGGLTLGGGMGWLGGKYGLALDNVLAVDIVTADGQLRHASADEHPDLFWAVRGGGGNFGVVTSFEYQLHPVGPLLTALVIYPLEQANDVLRFYHEFACSVPDELNTAAAVLTLPDGGPPVVGIAGCYNGDLRKGEAVFKPLRQFGQPLDVQIGPMSYLQVQHWLDPFFPEGFHYFETGHFMVDIAEAAADTLRDAYERTSSPGNVFVFQQQGNAVNRVPTEATAFAHRGAKYFLVIAARWADPAESVTHAAWARAARQALVPYATGGIYVNAIGREPDEGAEMVRSAYGSTYQRLVEVKKTYDPINVFRHNQNIRPL
jgi:FAD/FMN-containing dehydrogenase